MANSNAVVRVVAAWFLNSCTFTGLADYPICPLPTPAPVDVLGSSASVTDLAMVSGTASPPVAAYVPAGNCVEAVDEATGDVASDSCTLLGAGTGLVPHQPYVVNVNGGEAVFVTTSSQSGACPNGVLAFANQALGTAILAGSCDMNSVAALPAFTPFPSGNDAIAAWYQGPYGPREDPLGGCTTASTAPLVYAIVSNSGASGASIGQPAVLASGGGVSVRPPALVPLTSSGGVALAAPTGSGAGVWALDASGGVASSAPSAEVPGMSGAVAVAMGTDGADHLAVVAEIGCAPQSIAFSTGTSAGSFSTAVEVAPRGNSSSDAAFQPTVAWVTGRRDWLVTWISLTGGAHVLARRFSAAGIAEDATFNPSLPAAAAAADADGKVFAYDATSGQFETADLSCVP